MSLDANFLSKRSYVRPPEVRQTYQKIQRALSCHAVEQNTAQV